MFVRALKLIVPVALVVAMLLSIKACDPCTHCAHHPPPAPPNACIPSSSLSVLTQGNNVAAYVPDGNWSTNNLNVELVPIEGSTTAPAVPRTTIVTPKPVNSCSSNSKTGQTVCTSNDTDVYLITGAAITKTLTSGATGTTDFSGGTCSTCGVVVDATTNLAFLGIGLSGDQSGYQAINLANNTLQPPIVSGSQISEDIAVDPNRRLLLSPSEGNTYELVDLATGKVFDNAITNPGGELDSAGEDCTTGIALSTDEFTSKLLIADLKQATFVAGVGGAPGTWTAPLQLQDFPEFSALEAGTNGIAIAPNTHLGVVTGEFGGDNVGAIQLPATSGTGTPAVVDYVLLKLPLEPDGSTFAAGLDPHTVTAYVSPTSHKAFAIVADFPLNFLAVIDLQAMLSAARTPGTHIVDPAIDPIATGIVRYVKATGP